MSENLAALHSAHGMVLESHKVEDGFVALVFKDPENPSIVIEVWIGPHKEDEEPFAEQVL